VGKRKHREEDDLNRDRVLAFCTIVGASAYLFADAMAPKRGYSDPIGPKAFPAMIGIGLFFSGVLLLWETHKKAQLGAPGSGHPKFERTHLTILVAMAAWTAIYYLAFEPVGYLLATAIYLFPMLAYFNRGKWVANSLVAVGFSLAAYVVFAKLLQVTMPVGLLGF
jgi:putative tricarboxylic transport membrane protein